MAANQTIIELRMQIEELREWADREDDNAQSELRRERRLRQLIIVGRKS